MTAVPFKIIFASKTTSWDIVKARQAGTTIINDQQGWEAYWNNIPELKGERIPFIDFDKHTVCFYALGKMPSTTSLVEPIEVNEENGKIEIKIRYEEEAFCTLSSPAILLKLEKKIEPQNILVHGIEVHDEHQEEDKLLDQKYPISEDDSIEKMLAILEEKSKESWQAKLKYLKYYEINYDCEDEQYSKLYSIRR